MAWENNKPINFDHTLSTSTGSINLADKHGEWLVVYFYPKDNTPGCTTETADFNLLLEEFKALNCTIFGVSKDTVKSHQNFSTKLSLGFDLIADPDKKLCEHAGIMAEKSMFGKKYMGIERSTFLISPAGIVEKIWRKVKVNNHAQEVLEYLRKLTAND